MSTVERIQFNSIAFNAGAPPRAYGLGPVTEAADLLGASGGRQPCKVSSRYGSLVHCEASASATEKDKLRQIARGIVLRILVGGGR